MGHERYDGALPEGTDAHSSDVIVGYLPERRVNSAGDVIGIDPYLAGEDEGFGINASPPSRRQESRAEVEIEMNKIEIDDTKVQP